MEDSSAESLATVSGGAVKTALAGMGVSLDGKKVGEIVAGRLADQASPLQWLEAVRKDTIAMVPLGDDARLQKVRAEIDTHLSQVAAWGSSKQ